MKRLSQPVSGVDPAARLILCALLCAAPIAPASAATSQGASAWTVISGGAYAGADGTPRIYMGSDPTGLSIPPAAKAGASAAASEGDRSWPYSIGQNFGTPAFADLNHDGVMEIIATDRSKTYVLNAQGALLPGWPKTTGEVNHTPAVADIDEDGSPEILITSSGSPAKIQCLNLDGTQQAGFPVNLPYQYWLNSAGPVVADLDGDGHLDVGAQAEPGVGFFDRFGHPLPGWPYTWSTQQNIPWSAPAVADLDGDGRNEVVFGTNDLYSSAVYVVRSDGTNMPGWPQGTRVIFSSVALGDLDNDGHPEVVVQEGDNTWYGGRMHVWRYDGTELPGWPRFICDDWECSRSNPAIADVDNDGTREIVTVTADGKLHILRIDGSEFPGYPRTIASGVISSVQVIDLDGDSIEEILVCYAVGGQWVGCWKLDGTVFPGFPKRIFTSAELAAHSSTHVADMDGDGDFDLCAQGSGMSNGQMWVYEITGSVSQTATRAECPKIRRDAYNSGFFPWRNPSAAGDPIAARSFFCYPNPIRGDAQMHLRLPGAGTLTLSVLDPAGRRLAMRDMQGGRWTSLRLRDMLGRDPASGPYFIRWTGASGQGSARVVVMGE